MITVSIVNRETNWGKAVQGVLVAQEGGSPVKSLLFYYGPKHNRSKPEAIDSARSWLRKTRKLYVKAGY